MKLTVFSSDGTTSSEKDFANIPTFEGDKGLQAVKEVIVAINANNRQGTHSTKTRGEVRGGGKKPWRQKGTGRARAGSSRSPIWTGGGVTFGPQPRSYTFKVNRKERRAALRSALSLHADRGSLAGVDPAAFATPSTKQAAKLLKDWGSTSSVLVVVGADEANIALSFRNIDRVNVLAASEAGVADIVNAARLVVSQVGLDELSGRLSAQRTGEVA